MTHSSRLQRRRSPKAHQFKVQLNFAQFRLQPLNAPPQITAAKVAKSTNQFTCARAFTHSAALSLAPKPRRRRRVGRFLKRNFVRRSFVAYTSYGSDRGYLWNFPPFPSQFATIPRLI